MTVSDTIFALSSGPLPSGVAVIRLSGPSAKAVLSSLTGSVPKPRHAAFRRFMDVQGEIVDSGLALLFPAPNSFTGEDVVELQLHGSRAVVQRMFEILGSFSGVRLAEQGEFTKRAFLNGKLDLAEAEALADLIEAETEAQRRFALSNASGGQSALYESWRERLIHARAMLEADLDFSDQEDVPGSVADRINDDLAKLLEEIATHISMFHRAEIIRGGFDVVIMGPPNVGKSSLLNALAKRDVALVSDEAGTTRDLIEVELDLGGIKVRVTDTAGIRNSAGKVEALGIERALARAHEANLVIQLFDLTASEPPALLPNGVLVGNKQDLISTETASPICISTKTGFGLDRLILFIEEKAKDAAGNSADILPARQRHIDLLTGAANHIADVTNCFFHEPEIHAEDLRRASNYIGRITGRIDVEDILDVIFSRFCIGK